MDDFAQLLADEQDNPNGLLLELLTSGYEQHSAIIAIEGVDDQSFYFDFLDKIGVTANCRFLECGGKINLLKFKSIADDYKWSSPPNLIYICDKDFDDYLGRLHPGVWYTDRYSIESYIVDQDYISRSANKYSKSRLNAAKAEKFGVLYNNLFTLIASHTRVISAYMCEMRSLGLHPDFDLVNVSHIVQFRNNSIVPVPHRLQKICLILNISMNPSKANVMRWARQFDISTCRKWLRGKLALQIARKSYELAKRLSGPDIDGVPSHEPFLGGGALAHACSYVGILNGLEAYCRGRLGC